MLGKIIIYISSVAWLLSFFLFLFGENSKNEKFLKLAKYTFFIGISGIVLASIYLLFNIFSHNFTLTYVWSYSSRNLSFFFLLSSFYAGQEGSFLLWAFWLSLIGFILFFYLKKNQLDFLPLSFFSLTLVFISIILVLKSPFADLWESFPDGNIPKDFIPQDGRGLNPILENYWIAIHPPILFLGYALLTIPFTFALTSFWKQEYDKYLKPMSFWALLGAGILALGIMLGGFWAYETLGWGGFWAWDPVENSSLVPWIFITALSHTLLLQRIKGGYIRTNFVLAWLSFLGVLYASYLTRSGVLSDTSVHSFVDPGKAVNILLLIFLGVFAFFPLILFFLRTKAIPQSNQEKVQINSRQFFTLLGTIVLIVASIIVLVGTSLPIIQGFIGAKKVALEPSFYNLWMTPIAILLLVFNSISLMYFWKETPREKFLKLLFYSTIPSILISIVFFFLYENKILYSFLMFSSIFSLIVNVEKLINKIVKGNLRVGAFLSHLGIAFLIIGAMLSGGFEKTQTISLSEGKTAKALGYNFSLLKKERIELDKPDREKYRFHIRMADQQGNSVLKPIVYWSNFNNFEQPYYEPDIKTFLTRDIYLAPKSFMFEDFFKPVSLKKGDKIVSPWSNKDSIFFAGYDMSSMHTGKQQDHFLFGLVIKYYIENKEYSDTIYSILNMKAGSFSPVWKLVPTKDFAIGFTKFQPEENLEKSTVELSFGKEILVADVTVKPFIILVWLGVIFTVLGFIVAIFKYRNIEEKN
ncbi:MAG: cytochrome c biogenesis protein CcsA [Ignavibacteria bacterium]|nr:cytochrome c biogenesis protein CcsA [Ignavibacteria bacterium]